MAKSDFDTATPRPYITPSLTTPPYGSTDHPSPGGNHVAMGIERHHRSVAKFYAHDQVYRADHPVGLDNVFRHRMPLDQEAHPFQQFRRPRRMRRAIARRIIGRHLHELRQEGDLLGMVLVDIGADGLFVAHNNTLKAPPPLRGRSAMQSIAGWGVWRRLLADGSEAVGLPPTQRFRADLPLKGGGGA